MKKFLCYAKSNVEKPMTSKIEFQNFLALL